jgi:U2-associated protein SR140
MLEEGVDDKFLRTVADKVRNHGRSFEDMMREREKNNPRFAFFVNKKASRSDGLG